MTATTLDAAIESLFAAVGASDLSAVPALADALDDAGMTQQASILRGEDCCEVWIVPAFRLVTSARPTLEPIGDARGQRRTVVVQELGMGVQLPKCRTLWGVPMHHRSKATGALLVAAARLIARRVGVTAPMGERGRTVTVYVVDADVYGLEEV